MSAIMARAWEAMRPLWHVGACEIRQFADQAEVPLPSPFSPPKRLKIRQLEPGVGSDLATWHACRGLGGFFPPLGLSELDGGDVLSDGAFWSLAKTLVEEMLTSPVVICC